MEKLIYIDQVYTDRDAFENKVREISSKLGIDPNWLMAVFKIETAGTFSPSIQNKFNQATGLIQFTRTTAASYGTSLDELKSMSAVEQMDYVYRHLYPYRKKMDSFVDVYLAVFFPAAIGQGDDYVCQAPGLSAQLVASQNPGYDDDRNNEITVLEVKTNIYNLIDPVYHPYLKKKIQHY